MSIKEKDFEKWLLNQLESKQISELIDNLNEMKDLSNAYLNNPFISNVKGALYQLSVINWAKGVQLIDQLEFIKNQISIIKGRGRSSQIDILFHIKGKGTFSIIEIKRPLKQNNRNKSTIREAISELLGYLNGICSIFPGLPTKSNLLIIMSSEWPKIVSNAISLLSSFHGFSIIEINVEYINDHDFKLKIKEPSVGWTSKQEGISPEILNCFSINFSDDIINPQLLIEIIKGQIHDSGLHGLFLLSKNIEKKDNKFILSLYIINPYLFLKKSLNEIDISLIKQIFDLPNSNENKNLNKKLNEYAIEWSKNILILLENYLNIIKSFKIKIKKPFLDKNLKYYITYGHSNKITIWIDFFGFLSNYYLFWLQNKSNRKLIKSLNFDVDDPKEFALIIGNPLIKFLALSDIFEIAKFRWGFVKANDVFNYGRIWGKIVNLAQIGNEDEYDAELPIFFINFARSPFKIPIEGNKNTMANSGEFFVEQISKVLSKRGHPIFGYIFLLGYCAQSVYFRPKSAKDKNIYIPTNIEIIGNNLIEEINIFKLHNLSNDVSSLIKNICKIQLDLNKLYEIEKFIEKFEKSLKNESGLNIFGWNYRKGKLHWNSNLKIMIKHLFLEYKSRFKHPIIIVLPNGDYGIIDLEDIQNSKPLMNKWKKMDKDNEFMTIDFGEKAGVVRIIPFNKGDDPGKIIDERKIELNLTNNKTIICPYAEIDSKNFNCVFLKKQCPIKCSLDPPEFELFFKMCILDKNNKKSLLNFISTIKY